MKKKQLKVLLFSFIIASCSSDFKKNKIYEALNIAIPKEATDFEYYKYVPYQEYDKPYYIYIKFNIDPSGFKEILQQTNLVSYDSTYKGKMCLENKGRTLVSKFWNFYIDESIQKKIGWWNLDSSDRGNELYASFYREDAKKKFENCYLNSWDGHVLFAYNRKIKVVYIFIEVLAASSGS